MQYRHELQRSKDLCSREIQAGTRHDVAMGCTHHLHSLRHHCILWSHLRLPQSLCHPHRAHPTDEARHVPEQKGEFHGEAPLPHHGDDRGYLCSHPRHRTHDGYPELCGNGKPVAGGVCMADWRHSGIYPATCG